MADLLTNNILTLMPSINECRLTLETGVPVSTTDQTGKTTVYLTPYTGNRLALFNGTAWGLYAVAADKSLALGTLTSGKNYDVFGYDSSGTVTLELSAAWTNDSTRADALTTQDGILVKSGATTRRYLGTLRTTATTTTEDSAVKRFLWNQANRTKRAMDSGFLADSHSYTTAAWREWNNGSNSTRLEWVAGGDSLIEFACSVGGTAGGTFMGISMGLDLTNNASGLAYSPPISTSAFRAGPTTSYANVAAGYHYLAVVEYGGAGDTFADRQSAASLFT